MLILSNLLKNFNKNKQNIKLAASYFVTMSNDKHLTTGSLRPELPDDGVLRLYSMRFCPYAHRVHLVLDAKGIPYHSIYINTTEKPEWFKTQVSTTGKVPALQLVKETTRPILIESLIIADYLDAQYPNRPLYPNDPLKKAQDRILIERFGAFTSVMHKLLLNADDNAANDALEELFTVLAIYEEELKQRKTIYFAGAQPGMLDYMIWPWVERFASLEYKLHKPIELDAQRFEYLIKWRDLMLNDNAVKCFYLDGATHDKFLSTRRAGKTDYDILVNDA